MRNKSRIDAIKQLERIRRELGKKCYFNNAGCLITSHVDKIYEKACTAFKKLYGNLPTYNDIFTICYNRDRRNL